MHPQQKPQHKINPNKLKPGVVASYNIWPYWAAEIEMAYCHLLTYLDTYPLIYSPGSHTGPCL